MWSVGRPDESPSVRSVTWPLLRTCSSQIRVGRSVTWAAAPHLQQRDARVRERDAQPRLRRQLQRAHDEVADHVGVAAHDVDRVGALRVLGAPEQRAERALDARVVLGELAHPVPAEEGAILSDAPILGGFSRARARRARATHGLSLPVTCANGVGWHGRPSRSSAVSFAPPNGRAPPPLPPPPAPIRTKPAPAPAGAAEPCGLGRGAPPTRSRSYLGRGEEEKGA